MAIKHAASVSDVATQFGENVNNSRACAANFDSAPNQSLATETPTAACAPWLDTYISRTRAKVLALPLTVLW